MYRIEVAPGEETVFRTIDELAVGIRNGVITPRSRIYHNASKKWLPIALHPHYKKAMELPAASAAHPAPKVPSPVTSPVVAMRHEVLRDLPVVVIPEPEPLPWTAPPEPVAPKAPPIPAPAPIARIAQAVQSQPTARVTYAPLVVAEPAVEPTHARPTARRAPRAGGRPLLLLGVAALVVGMHFAFTAPRSTPADDSEPSRAEPTAAEPAAAGEYVDQSEPAETPDPARDSSPRVTIAPARVPMTPGPAFAGSAPTRAGADSVPRRSPPSVPSPLVVAQPASAIEPAPVRLDLALPDLATDSMVPAARSGDSMAMKKILRALNGAKPEAANTP